MKTVRINVTRKHILKGTPKKPYACPIALAMLDAGFTNPRVHPEDFRANDFDFQALPDVAQRFVMKFDDKNVLSRRFMSPISFDVEIPE